MKAQTIALAFVLSAFPAAGCGGGAPEGPAQPAVSPWPRTVPCRIDPGNAPRTVFLTLGEVDTPLADGTFDPAADRVRLKDGTAIDDYYKTRLGVSHYAPIDKSVFPLPPAGWCSWYFYYPDITPAEVIANARWLAANLKPYGATWCQIDDGWQTQPRDWDHFDQDWPDGPRVVVDEIKRLGLRPGLWIAPHGHTDKGIFQERPELWLKTADGRSASNTWVGDYLLDPRPETSLDYLEERFERMRREWGFEYFKIDGQPIVVDEYKRILNDADSRLYRGTIERIRRAIGPETYLLGCWGTAAEGIGYFNGSRTGGDVNSSRDGLGLAREATLNGLHLNNVCWYSDPDVLLVRPPLTLTQARTWATLVGITGQALMITERLPDLTPDRVEVLKRVFPPADIRPLDLFRVSEEADRFVLLVNRGGEEYALAACFNWDDASARTHYLRWDRLGFRPGAKVHAFDFWEGQYLGSWETGLYLNVPPNGVRLICLKIDDGKPALVSTNRHITQGYVELGELSRSADGLEISGRSALVAGDPYELRFGFPVSGENRSFRISSAEASGLDVETQNYLNWGAVRFTPRRTGEVAWRVRFEETDAFVIANRFIDYEIKPRLESLGDGRVVARWNPAWQAAVAFRIYRDGESAGVSHEAMLMFDDVKRVADLDLKVLSGWYW